MRKRTDSLIVEDGSSLSPSSQAGRRNNTRSSAQLTMHEEGHIHKMRNEGSLSFITLTINDREEVFYSVFNNGVCGSTTHGFTVEKTAYLTRCAA